jgi:CRP/FNR family cyclic AMP-dependent transcriptional regulator
MKFIGAEGRSRQLLVLSSNPAIRGDDALAAAIADAASIEAFKPGDVLISQGHDDTRVAFLLSGRVNIHVNGRHVATREAPAHIGEMAAIDPKAPRSATVTAATDGCAAWIDDAALLSVTRDHPQLWRGFARELADRLREREKHYVAPNHKPRVFIGSSVESLPVANALVLALDHDPIEIVPWATRTFRPSNYTVPDLLRQVERCDFAIFCLGPDDVVTTRGATSATPRDNVVFEGGLFMGRIGHERVFLVRPRGVTLRLPSDLHGFNLIDYRDAPGEPPVVDATCEQLRRAIRDLGPR